MPGRLGVPLNAEDLFQALLKQGRLSVRDLLDTHVTIEEVRGRNLNHRVTLGLNAGFFVKQPRSISRDLSEGVVLEAGIYELFELPQFEELRRHVPQRLFADDERQLLALELLSDGPAASAVAESSDPEWLGLIGQKLGRLLALCHSGFSAPPKVAGAELTQRTPWALSLHRPTTNWLFDITPAQMQLVRLVQSTPILGEVLEELRITWRPSALIHGDVKLSNVLLPPTRDATAVHLVDWELARWGDPLWDIGSAWHSLLAIGLGGADWCDAADADDAAQRLGQWVAERQAYAQALWRGYAGGRDLVDSETEVRRTALFCAARMLQWAYELSSLHVGLSREATAAVQISMNIGSRPLDAATALFGVTPRE
jgi:hypothetical protein